MKGVASWNSISNKVCWFLDRLLRCLYFLIQEQWFSGGDSAQTGHINCRTRSFSSSPRLSQNQWSRRVLSAVWKISIQYLNCFLLFFYFCLYPYAHTFCSWLISFCLVWRATKACSCSICSCCFSSPASCICWGETERGEGCGYDEGCYSEMIFDCIPKEIPSHDLSPLIVTDSTQLESLNSYQNIAVAKPGTKSTVYSAVGWLPPRRWAFEEIEPRPPEWQLAAGKSVFWCLSEIMHTVCNISAVKV